MKWIPFNQAVWWNVTRFWTWLKWYMLQYLGTCRSHGVVLRKIIITILRRDRRNQPSVSTTATVGTGSTQLIHIPRISWMIMYVYMKIELLLREHRVFPGFHMMIWGKCHEIPRCDIHVTSRTLRWHDPGDLLSGDPSSNHRSFRYTQNGATYPYSRLFWYGGFSLKPYPHGFI